MEILDTFIHTNRDIHGENCADEFLIPDIFTFEPKFIGLTSGKDYENGLIVGTHKTWDANSLLELANNLKSIGFFEKNKKRSILKKYIEQLKSVKQKFPDYIVGLDDSLNINPIESRKDFLSKRKLKPLSNKKKEGYKKLAEFCLNQKDYDFLSALITKLNDYDGHWEFYSTLNFIMNQLDINQIHFIMALDWKAEISDLIWRISSALKNNYSQEFTLPDINKYPANASVSYEGVFEDFKVCLNIHDFELGFIKTDGDEYVILVHRKSNTKEVSDAVKSIGYKYDNKINSA